MQRRKNRLAQLKKQVEKKALSNATLEQDVASMQVAVAERRHIYEAAGEQTRVKALGEHTRAITLPHLVFQP